MGLDWDALVLKPAMAIFGAGATIQRPGEPAFTVADAVFDRAHEMLTYSQDGAPISTRQPVLGVRQGALPAGFEAAQGDLVSVEGATFAVMDVQPDGKGGWKLMLTSREDEGP